MSGIQWKVPGIQTQGNITHNKEENQSKWPRYDKDDINYRQRH